MKQYCQFIFIFLLLLYLTGCEETRPEIIQNFMFAENEEWLERDTTADAFELVDGQCCNDYYPYPLPIDTTVYPFIEPAGDLDYFDLQTTSSKAGWLSLSSIKENVTLRIFSSNFEEYGDFLLGTFYDPDNYQASPEYWTSLLFLGPSQSFPDTSLTILVIGESASAHGEYTLKWHGVVEEPDLAIKYPLRGVKCGRPNKELINWVAGPGESVEAALLKGPVIVQFISSSSDVTYDEKEPKIYWYIPQSLEPGTDYRILLYYANNPKRMNISDAFEIY